MAELNNGKIPKWLKCMVCKEKTSFCPEAPKYHRLLIELIDKGQKREAEQVSTAPVHQAHSAPLVYQTTAPPAPPAHQASAPATHFYQTMAQPAPFHQATAHPTLVYQALASPAPVYNGSSGVAGVGMSQEAAQTILIRLNRVEQSLTQTQVAHNTQMAELRNFLRGQFRVINNNMRSYGGTMQGSLVRQRQSNRGTNLLRGNQSGQAPPQIEIRPATLSTNPKSLSGYGRSMSSVSMEGNLQRISPRKSEM